MYNRFADVVEATAEIKAIEKLLRNCDFHSLCSLFILFTFLVLKSCKALEVTKFGKIVKHRKTSKLIFNISNIFHNENFQLALNLSHETRSLFARLSCLMSR